MSSLDTFLEEYPQNDSSCPEIVNNYTEHPSLKAFLRNYPQYAYSVSEIVEHYSTWIKDTRYMLLSKWNKVELKNDVFAVKSVKRGNDVYRSRVRRKFEDLCSMTQDLTLFNPKERGIKKKRALWITLTYRIDRCTFGVAWRNSGVELNRFMSSGKGER